MDETYIKVNGQWKYLYRAVDKEGATIDFLLRARRDTAAATRFFEKAMRQNGDPEEVAMDKSGANKAAMDEINQDRNVPIEVRQVKYLNNIIEQDHRFVKRVTKPMLGFKSFRTASAVLSDAFIRKPPHNAPLDCHPSQLPFTTLIHLGCVCFNETFHPTLKQLPVRLEPLLACIAGCPTPASPPQKAHTGAARVRSSMPVNRLGKICRIPSKFAQGWLGG